MTQISKPHLRVASLRYTLQPDERFSYDNPPPVKFETEEARFHLAEGILTCEMRMDFSDTAAARKVVDPVLQAWETWVDLRQNYGQLRFKFDKAEIIDRSPTPGDAVVVLAGAVAITATGTAPVRVTNNNYPDPPPDFFRLNPDCESMLHRYRGYLDKREPLPSMAYFCLTVFEKKNAHGRLAAVRKYRVDKNVLDTIGVLSSTRGGALDARKADAVQPLSSAESAWLEAAVKNLIQRLGDAHKAHLICDHDVGSSGTVGGQTLNADFINQCAFARHFRMNIAQFSSSVECAFSWQHPQCGATFGSDSSARIAAREQRHRSFRLLRRLATNSFVSDFTE